MVQIYQGQDPLLQGVNVDGSVPVPEAGVSSVTAGGGSPGYGTGMSGTYNMMPTGGGTVYSNALVDFGNTVGPVLGGIGSFIGGQNTANQQSNAQSLARNSVLQPFNFSNNGFTGYNNGGGQFGVTSPFSGATGGLAQLANSSIGAANNIMQNGLPSNVIGGYNQYGQNFGTANSGMNSLLQNSLAAQNFGAGTLGAGFQQLNNPLIGQATGAAGNLIGQAGSDFTSVYNTQLQNLLKQMQLPQQLAMNANQQQQFGTGRLGAGQMGINGASGPTNMQTFSLGQGFGQANLSAAQNAFNMALASQNSATQNAGVLGTLASNQQLTGAQLLGTGFNGITAPGYLGLGASTGLNTLGTNNLNLQGQYATLPSALSGANLTNLLNPALSGASTINNMGLSNFNAGLSGGEALANSSFNASRGLTSLIPTSANTQGNNILSSLGNPNTIAGITKLGTGIAGGISKLFGGNSSGPDYSGPDLSGFGGSSYDPYGTGFGMDTSGLMSGGTPDMGSLLNGTDVGSLLGDSGGGGSGFSDILSSFDDSLFSGAGGQAATAAGPDISSLLANGGTPDVSGLLNGTDTSSLLGNTGGSILGDIAPIAGAVENPNNPVGDLQAASAAANLAASATGSEAVGGIASALGTAASIVGPAAAFYGIGSMVGNLLTGLDAPSPNQYAKEISPEIDPAQTTAQVKSGLTDSQFSQYQDTIAADTAAEAAGGVKPFVPYTGNSDAQGEAWLRSTLGRGGGGHSDAVDSLQQT